MAKMVNAVLVLAPSKVMALIEAETVFDCSRVGLSEGFLSLAGEVLEKRTGYSRLPSVVLTEFYGERVSVESLGVDVGAVFPTAPINFVFDLKIPADMVVQCPLEWARRINSLVGKGEDQTDLLEELQRSVGDKAEDMIGFVPEVRLEWITRFAVLNEEWELVDRSLKGSGALAAEFKKLTLMDDVIEHRRARNV